MSTHRFTKLERVTHHGEEEHSAFTATRDSFSARRSQPPAVERDDEAGSDVSSP